MIHNKTLFLVAFTAIGFTTNNNGMESTRLNSPWFAGNLATVKAAPVTEDLGSVSDYMLLARARKAYDKGSLKLYVYGTIGHECSTRFGSNAMNKILNVRSGSPIPTSPISPASSASIASIDAE